MSKRNLKFLSNTKFLSIRQIGIKQLVFFVISLFASSHVFGEELKLDSNTFIVNALVGGPTDPVFPGPGEGSSLQNYVPPKTYTYNFNEINNVETNVPTLTTELMGDHIDPATGSVSWTQTDVNIPGNFELEVAIKRELLDPGSWPRATREFGNWSLAIPHIRSSYVTNTNGSFSNIHGSVLPAWYRGEACSAGLNSNPDFLKSIQGSQFKLDKEDYWQGDTINIPGIGSTSILQDGSTKKTVNQWKIECVNLNNLSAFKVTLPNGTIYTFSELKKIRSFKDTFLGSVEEACLQQCSFPIIGNERPDDKLRMAVVNVFMQVTEVRDRFGNWVKYDYDDDSNLIKIYSSDNRTIDIEYTGSDERRISKVTANNRNWIYTYQSANATSVSDMYLLTKATLPDGRKWQYSYPTNSNTKFWSTIALGEHDQVDPFNPAQCNPGDSGSYIGMTHPSGARGDFDILGRCAGQAAVPKLQNFNRFGQGASFQSYALPISHQQYSISNKSITLQDNTVYNWNYSYNNNLGYYYSDDNWPFNSSFSVSGLPSNADISFIEEDLIDVSATLLELPDGSYQLSISDRRYGFQNGKQLYYAVYDDNYNLTGYTKYKYNESTINYGSTKQQVHGISEYIVYPIPPEFNGQVYFDQAITSSKHIRLVSSEFVLKDGNVSTSYKEQFSNFNSYEKAQQITQNGPSGNRRVKLGFSHDTGTWVLNQPTTVDVSINNESYKRLSEKVYYSATHSNTAYRFNLKEEKYFGTVRKSYPNYQTVSNARGQIKDVDLHLNTTGGKRRITFDNYKRGQAQTIKVPQRYSTGTMSMTKVVDNNGWVLSTTNFNGVSTKYTYTPMGLIKSVNLTQDNNYSYGNWKDTLFSYTYPSSGGLIRTISKCVLNSTGTACGGSVSLKTTETYDALYRLIKTQASGSNQNRYQSFEYDFNNKTTFESFLSSNSNESRGTYITYDPLQRVLSKTTSGLGTSTFNYLAANKVEVINPRGFDTVTTYRAFSSPLYQSPLLIESPAGVNTQTVYDTFGNVISITQSGGGKSQTESRYYDSNNNLCFISRNDIGKIRHQFNLLGELEWQAHGNVNSCSTNKPSNAVTMIHDNLGDLKTVNYPDSTPDVNYTLDKVGNVTALTSGSVNQSYIYNNQNVLESEVLTIPGRSGTLNIDYRYNADLHQTSIVYPVTNNEISFSPNAFGEPTKATRIGQTYASNASYHPSGVIKSFTYGNSAVHQTLLYSLNNLPSRTSDVKGNTRLSWFDYSYDENANIIKIIDGTDNGYTVNSMTYDGLDRLIGISANSKAGNSTVNYDALGNITKLVTKDRVLNYSYNASNRLTSVSSTGNKAKNYGFFNYDSRGNITNNSHFTMAYNLANQISSAKGNSYSYDGYGRRVKASGNGNTSYYLYSQSGKLLFSERNGTRTNYIYLGHKLIAEDSAGGVTFIHSDLQGSPVARSNTAGALLSRKHYKPFGDTYETDSYEVGYTGHQFDNDLGLSYMQARYYDPVIGRFYSNDPVGWTPKNPVMSFNRYLYVNNNPYKYTDPNGEFLKLAKAAFNVIKRAVKNGGDFKKAGADELASLADNLATLADGQLTLEDAFAVVDLATGFGDEVKSISKAISKTKDGAPRIKQTFSDGSTLDITDDRVKGYTPNTHPSAPEGTMQKVEFENAQPGSKGYKRDPTPEERQMLDEARNGS